MFKRFALIAAASVLAATTAAAGDLGIGDPAPKLSVKNWVKGDPVAGFEKGHVYVVEFWATWCGPCKKSIPHLSKLQEKYAEKATFIGVSIWESDQAEVAPFVEKMGKEMAYTVATDMVPEDSDGEMAQAWMKAAGMDGIPTAFIVNREGRVAWMGHPMVMDEPLAQVIAGEWDIEVAAAEHNKKKEGENKWQAVYDDLNAAMHEKNWEAAVKAADEIITLNAEYEKRVGPTKFQALLNMEAFDKAYGYGATLVDGAIKNDAFGLNMIAWVIVDPEAPIKKQDLELALRAAKRANELTYGENAAILDTVAKVYFDMGDFSKALELQKKACDLSKGTELEAELNDRLEQYKKALETTGV